MKDVLIFVAGCVAGAGVAMTASDSVDWRLIGGVLIVVGVFLLVWGKEGSPWRKPEQPKQQPFPFGDTDRKSDPPFIFEESNNDSDRK